jgi:hypothetical protein
MKPSVVSALLRPRTAALQSRLLRLDAEELA